MPHKSYFATSFFIDAKFEKKKTILERDFPQETKNYVILKARS